MILVVASHPQTREAIIPLIADRGYRVAAVNCGDEFLSVVRFRPPSLVILDCDLSDSFGMLAKMRAEPRTAAIPVVMYSETGGKVRTTALGNGADAFVEKGSLDWFELMTEIARFVGPPPSAEAQSD